jgi:hypothetical protein
VRLRRQVLATASIALLVIPVAVAGTRGSAAASGDAVRAYRAAVHLAKGIGPRPSASKAERHGHTYVADRFRAAGMRVSINGFRVPGRGRSRNVVGILDTPRGCLKILMGHTDSVTQGPGANDNASGVGVLVALAGRVESLDPRCDLWLVATGSEEREVTGLADHRGATALVKRVRRHHRAGDLRYALSLDMVGRGKRFYMRSPRSAPRKGIERQVLKLAKRNDVPLHWERDSSTGNSDHREFELAGLPGMVIEVWKGYDPCHHQACDRAGRLKKVSLRLALRLATEVAQTG